MVDVARIVCGIDVRSTIPEGLRRRADAGRDCGGEDKGNGGLGGGGGGRSDGGGGEGEAAGEVESKVVEKKRPIKFRDVLGRKFIFRLR